ncbi:MAG: hypothetical protein K0S61_142 [Anaerocolumna sp.]|nr:hypothetical protein [Anaerocolumna sp.]
MMKIRTYTELIKFKTFEERYNYLRLGGTVGESTFGFDRYLNQLLYNSRKWKKIRDDIIIRDNACDLGLIDFEIYGSIFVHHMNPITIEDIENESPIVFNHEFLISSSDNTHKAIHFSNESLLFKMPVERKPNDTCPWR